jgi:anti-sigma B factor antagonist
MANYERITVNEMGDVTVVGFVDRKILDVENIQALGNELFSLIEDGRRRLLLNFDRVEFLSSAALNKLILLDSKLKAQGGSSKLCNLRPEIREVFFITRLDQFFDIRDTETEALNAF